MSKQKHPLEEVNRETWRTVDDAEYQRLKKKLQKEQAAELRKETEELLRRPNRWG